MYVQARLGPISDNIIEAFHVSSVQMSGWEPRWSPSADAKNVISCDTQGAA